ncbi:MAG: glycosyltransferase [Candidatus Micrarchaeaceae archaeon]
MPHISVVIPTYNEEKYIGGTLSALSRQSFKDFDVIVVDKESKDKTKEIVRNYGARVITVKKRGIALARNAGAKAAKGPIILFIDADTVASRNLLATYSKAFSDNNIIAATGPILPLERQDWLMMTSYKFVSVLFVRLSIALGRPSIVGSNFAVRKDVFDAVHGFNERFLTYEDWDLSNRIKKFGRILYIKDAVVHTSTRRIESWGIKGYFFYHVGNMFRYHLLNAPKKEYKPIR